MYTVIIESTFCAIHRVRMPDGTLEPPHGHDFRVRAYLSGEMLDENDMVVDFHAAQVAMHEILAPLQHTDLNEHPAFASGYPTAERIARHVFDALVAAGFRGVTRVELTEAPGCVAVYEA
ncbi:MAG: 6-carboxytetrahydropterin synthase [Phycisphaerae bacterium]|nr:6-carboxytetrahydropterin synthase [Phycisphaerae bacterium]